MSDTLEHPTRPIRRISEDDAFAIGTEAYHYLFPLVLMHVTRRININYLLGEKPGCGPEGMFHHIRKYPPVAFKDVVRPNFDTLRSMAWIDLSKGPVVVSIPETQGRYFILPLHDMWSDVFAALGTRTIGSSSAHFAITPPFWNGTIPSGVERIEAPTNHIWIVGRTQTHGPKDYGAVYKIQDGYMITLLSQWGRPIQFPAEKMDPAVDVDTSPENQVAAMSPANFFNYAAELMKIDMPHPTDGPILAQMKLIGLEAGKSFRLKKAPAGVQAGLEAAPAEARRQMTETVTMPRAGNGWLMKTEIRADNGNSYLARATVAAASLGALPSEDAVYAVNVANADGAPAVGEDRYVLHFRRNELPPARGFWSLTMYDRDGFPARNAVNRRVIGDLDELTYNGDGSLDIYIQKDKPISDKASNWLPSLDGPLGMTMRLYSPRAETLDGHWFPPCLQRVKE